MEETTRGGGMLARVGLGPDEPLEGEVRRHLGHQFSLLTDDSRDGGVDLRLFGPVELAGGRLRLLRAHRLHHPAVPALLILPERFGADELRACFREGVADAFHPDELERHLVPALANALHHRDSGRALADTAQLMAAELGKRARELEHALLTVRENYDQTLGALVGALDCRERETACHSQRVALYAVMLGMELELDEVSLEDLYRGSLLHDLGKIGTPDSVLLKPAQLSPDEWEIMREHPNLGAELCRRIDFLRGAADVPLAHHEAFDGSGYPRGLEGETIPLHARIFAVVDTYDAIRSERPYKPALGHDEALTRLGTASGSRLDPRLVDVFNGVPKDVWQQLAERVAPEASFERARSICREIRSR